MSDSFRYSIRHAGLFQWEWRAYLPAGGVVEGRSFSKGAAKRAAISRVKRETAAAARAPDNPTREDREREMLQAARVRQWPPRP